MGSNLNGICGFNQKDDFFEEKKANLCEQILDELVIDASLNKTSICVLSYPRKYKQYLSAIVKSKHAKDFASLSKKIKIAMMNDQIRLKSQTQACKGGKNS